MRKLKLFLDAKAANTPPRGISKASRVIFPVLTLLFLSIGQMWAVEYDALYESGTFSSLDAFGYTQNKTFTLNNKGWKASVAQVNSSVFYLGCNSGNAAKGVLNNNSDFSDIVTALASADATYNTNKTTAHAYALLFNNSYDNVTKVEFTWDGGNNAFQVYLFGYTGTAWTKLANTNYATSGAAVSGSVTWTGSATNYSKFAIAARPGTTSTATNKTIRPATFKIYKTKAAAYTITAVSNNDLWGTVSGTTTITATPASGYRVKAGNAGYTVTSGTATVTNNGDNTFSVTPSANCTVQINFEAIPTYTVTWNNNGSTNTTQVVEGAKPTFPAKPASCATDCDEFYGWATEAWTGKLTDISGKTIHTSNATMDAVTAEGTVYYAVFTDVVATDYSTTYTSNVTLPSSGTNVSSATLVIGENDDIDAFKLGKSGAGAASSFTVPSGTTKIYLHAAAWNGKTVSLTLATDVGSISPDDAQDLTSNSGIANSSPFTLNTTGTGFDFDDLFFEYTLENVDDEAEITVTASGERAVIWGVNAVASASSGDAHYMTTCAACTHLDDAPELDGTIAVTHNTATIKWKTLTNASSYDVTVIRNSDSESIFSGNVNALTKALTGLDPETQYDYSIMGVGDGSTYCTTGNGVLNGSFTTDAAPTAHLTLIDINGTHASSGDYVVGTPFNLPTTAATCAKTFVGWDANDECVTAPTYAKGASFTFANTTGVTLYAVYADVAPGTTTNIAYTDTETTTNMTGANDAALLGLDADEWSVVGAKGGNTNFPGLNKAKDIRLYYQSGDIGNTITITAPQAIESVALTFTGESYSNAWVKVGDELVTLSNGVYPINASSFVIGNANTTNVQVRISNIAVNFLGAQSNWATTCVDPLENPTFSLDPVVTPVEDKYTEAINVVITNNAGEGKIYYTTNNQTPTSASTEYAGAITLNTCGTKTIKAIVISDNNQSEVVSATYEMAIPIPSVSAEDPYTEAEAVAVIDGGCYNNEDVYVTGTVASNGAAWYPNSGTYTITLENGFKFYYFYEGENEQSFTDNYIAAGDVLVAKGKLEKSGNTYRLAQGCYLVSRTPAQKTPIDSDIDNPITVADALGYIDQAATYDLTNVYVKGVASEDPDNQGTFNIHDAGVENSLQIYKGVLRSALITAGVEVEENDTIIAVGELTKYYSTYEMAEGGEIVVVKKYIAPVVAVTGVEVDATATVKAGKTVQLTANVLPDNATNKNVTWTVESGDAYAEVSATGLVTGKAEGTAVIRATSVADDTKYGECTVTVNPGTPANTDILTAEEIGVSGPYDSWSGKNTFGTTSVYAGNSTTGTGTNAGAIQLRYHATDETKQAGIVLTGSNGMYLKNFEVTVKSGSNVLNVYAKNTAYSSKADLYSDDEDVCGKLIGTVSATGNLQLEDGVFYNDNYQYIGMRSAGGALYLEDITITWGAAYVPPTVYTVTFNSNGGSAVDAADVNEGDAVAKPADPTKDDYNFVEWQLNGVAYDFTAAVTANITLDAVWEPVTPPTPTYETVRTGLTAGNYYTICYPKAMTDVQGATLWSFVGKDADFAYIVQETATTIEAGKPYILYATASTVTAVIGTDDASAGVNGAIHGTLDPMDQTALNTAATDAGKDLYLVIGNQLRKATGYANDGITPLTGNSLPANRAFVVLGDIPNAPAHMPAHVRSMPLHKDTATGMDELNASETPVKVMIDGQLFILRGEKLYDATGRLVK